MSQFKVYTEHFVSEAFDRLEDAREWAQESGGATWFEIVDLVTAEVVYTAEDWEYSIYYQEETV